MSFRNASIRFPLVFVRVKHSQKCLQIIIVGFGNAWSGRGWELTPDKTMVDNTCGKRYAKAANVGNISVLKLKT